MIVEAIDLPPLERIPAPRLREALAELLVAYRAAMDGEALPDSKFWVRKLFGLLGWGNGDAALREHRRVVHVAGGAEILECELFGYDAFKVAVLPVGEHATWVARATEAVEYLYNHGDEWTVVSDFERLEIVNVRWIDKQRGYVPFRRLAREEYLDEAHTLTLLTPARIRDRDLFQQADVEWPRKKFDKARPGDRTIRPPITKVILDQVLASREAFLHDPPEGQTDAEAYDNQIHRLLTRLIFIRACEDMQLQVSAPLRTLLGEDKGAADLKKILSDYRELYNSELFDELDLSLFRWNLVRDAVRSLYRIPDVVDFNFAAIEADVLGAVYEDYLQWQAVRVVNEDAATQRVMFGLKRVATENIKRERGIYYTPAFLVEAMVERALELVGAPQGRLSDGRPVLVADLACGSGAFLSTAFQRVAEAEQNASYQTAAVLLQQMVTGVDIDPRAIEATRLNLWLTLFRLDPRVHPLPRLAQTVSARDALIGPLLAGPRNGGSTEVQPELFAGDGNGAVEAVPTLARRPDVILGNPPFVSLERIDPAYRIRLRDEGYTTVTGRYDLANVFVERALDAVREGGIVALVVPNRIFTTAAAASLRQIIAEKAEIAQVIDFGTEQVFAATTYVSVVFLRRIAQGVQRRKVDAPVVKVDRLVEPRGLQLREALAGKDTPGIRRYTVQFPRTSDPILLVPGEASSLIRRLQSQGTSLGEVADTSQGTCFPCSQGEESAGAAKSRGGRPGERRAAAK
jgi:methylase of polypeptide subunit release factors